MKLSEFAEKYLGIKLHAYQKQLIENMGQLCMSCPDEKRKICSAYGGFCNKWKRLKDKSEFLNLLLYQKE